MGFPPVTATVAPSDGQGKEHAPRERSREPVREPEVCIRFRDCRGGIDRDQHRQHFWALLEKPPNKRQIFL